MGLGIRAQIRLENDDNIECLSKLLVEHSFDLVDLSLDIFLSGAFTQKLFVHLLRIKPLTILATTIGTLVRQVQD